MMTMIGQQRAVALEEGGHIAATKGVAALRWTLAKGDRPFSAF